MPDLRRREFIAMLGGGPAAWPLAARAQQRERMRRIGMLMISPPMMRKDRRRSRGYRERPHERVDHCYELTSLRE